MTPEQFSSEQYDYLINGKTGAEKLNELIAMVEFGDIDIDQIFETFDWKPLIL